MNILLMAVLTVYGFVALGVVLEIVPRSIFEHPVERFIVRVSCGLIWPFLVGVLLARKVSKITTDSDFKEQG